MSDRPFLDVRGLSKAFFGRRPLGARLRREPAHVVRAAQDVSFAIPRGRTFALVGESGSGKSTIAQMVVGLLASDAGTIEVDGIAVDAAGARRAELRQRVQMVFQDPYTSLNPRWRVGAIVAEPLHALGLSDAGTTAADTVAELLAKVGLHASDAERYPHEFSGGQRQRIAIARTLAARADLVVCDEPTSALDVSVQAQILNLMRDLQDEFGLTYLFISHNLAVVRFMADAVGVLKGGVLVEAGEAGAVLDAPRHPYTRALLEAVLDPALALGAASRETAALGV